MNGDTMLAHPGRPVLVLLGATGDMATSKLLPALQQLHRDGRLPIPAKLICVADDSEDEIRERVEGTIRRGYRREGYVGEVLERLTEVFDAAMSTEYISGDLRATGDGPVDDQSRGSAYVQIKDALAAFPSSPPTFYCSVPPRLYLDIAHELHRHELTQRESGACIVFEKPFGIHNSNTKRIVDFLTEYLQGQAILVDHYLYKPMVVEIRNLREKYPELDAIWKAPHIQQVQITVAESEGIGDRGAFYEDVGALLDMVQNHVLQLLCVITMEAAPPPAHEMTLFDVTKNLAPTAFSQITDAQLKNAAGQAIQNIFGDDLNQTMLAAAQEEAIAKLFPELSGQQERSTKALASVQFPEELNLEPSPERWLVRGQYDGYRRELHVAEDSNVETFVALQVQLNDPRWEGVPFFLRTGKCMSHRTAVIRVHFANGDHITFRVQPTPQVVVSSGARLSALKRLVADGVAITEAQDVAHRAVTEEHGAGTYEDDAYNSILIGCLSRDLEHAVAVQWVTASWNFVGQIKKLWQSRELEAPLRFYRSGSNGPDAADRLIRDAGYDWMSLGT